MADGCSRPPWLAASESQPERDHLGAIAYQQAVTGQHRMVPGLALQRRKVRYLCELVRGGLNQREFALFRDHQQQVLIAQQNQLALAVASSLPLARAILGVEAGENAAVETEHIAIVDDGIVKARPQPARRPTLFGGPTGRPVGYRDTAHPDSAHRIASCDQKAAIRRHGRLHNAGIGFPRVFPKWFAIRRSDTRGPGRTHQHNLRDAVDGYELWRAVAIAAVRAEPARGTGGQVVSGQLAGSGDDYHVAKNQRRTGEAPARRLHARVGRSVARP